MRIVIPSHDRAGHLGGSLLYTLKNQDLRKSIPIDIFVTSDQLEVYSNLLAWYPMLDISLHAGVLGLANQRNYIRSYYPEGEKLIWFDDDCIPISDVYVESVKVFQELEQSKLGLCSVSPTNNAFYNKKGITSGLYFAYGCMYWEINSHHYSMYLDESLGDELEDYFRTMKSYMYYGNVLRNWDMQYKHHMYKLGGILSNCNKQARIDNHNRNVNIFVNLYTPFVTLNGTVGQSLKIKLKYWASNSIVVKKRIGELECGTYLNPRIYLKSIDRLKIYRIYGKLPDGTEKLIALTIPNIWNYIRKLTPEAIETLRVASNKNNLNRGDIAGKIDMDRLPGFAKDHLAKHQDKITYNQNETRIFTDGGYDMSNSFHSYTLGYTTYKNNVGKLSYFDKLNKERLDTQLREFVQDISRIYINFYDDTIPSDKYMDSVFTSITVNNGNTAAIHVDKYNEGFCAHLAFNHSNGAAYTGGDLVFPEYGLYIESDPENPTLTLFDSKYVKHCTTELVKVNKEDTRRPNRLSLVFFRK
jgi:hypothetical protein